MTRPLRILHIGNGRAYKIGAIVAGLAERGHDNQVVPIPPSEPGFTANGWHRLDDSWLPGQTRVAYRMVQLRGLVHRVRPDIVHAHNAWGPGWYGAATGHHPFVIHAYGGDLLPEQYAGRPRLQRWLTSWACRAADRIIVTGGHMVEASAELGIDKSRVVVLPRGVNVRHFRPGLDPWQLRATLNIPPGAPIVLSPRYQIDEALYNLDVVVKAFGQVAKAVPAAVCVQLYDVARQDAAVRLRKLAVSLGLAQRYLLVPSVDNEAMPTYYAMADVAVSVPSSDGFPVTVLEASACACPLVVSDLPYTKDWFADGENGVVVPVRDSPALARAIVNLLNNSALRIRLGAAARLLVEQHANSDHCMDALIRMYYELTADRSRPQLEAI